jgi:uncharacterized protein (DUF433 family)
MATVARTPLAGPSHIYLDPDGVAWIGHTNIKVVEVAMDSAVLEMTPPQIHDAHPGLSLAQIHAALAYYHDHKTDIDRDIAARETKADRIHASARDQLSRSDLEARLRSRSGDAAT